MCGSLAYFQCLIPQDLAMLGIVFALFVTCSLVTSSVSELTEQQKLTEIEKRLKEYVEKDNTRCHKTGWGETYAELHKKLLESPTGKRLVAVPHLSGMADRIVGFTTGLALAILTDRAFQMGKRGALPHFEQAFEQPHINWSRDPDADWLIAPLAENANPKQYNQSILDAKTYYAVNTINDFRHQEDLAYKEPNALMGGDAQTTMLVTNRGKTIRMFGNPAHNKRFTEQMGLNDFSLFGCLVNYAIQPKKEIFLPVFDQFEKMSKIDPQVLKISIQIRAGDHVWANNGHHSAQTDKDKEVLQSFQRFFSCAEQIETFVKAGNPGKYSSVLWYLATDSKALRHAAVAHYGDKLVTSLHSTLEHSAKESSVCVSGAGSDCSVSANGFTSAAAEWWMLGYADYHVITLYSGFGRSGAYRTLEQERIYTLNQKAMECTPKSFTEHGDMVFEWAGI